jgi:glycosyltransferase involved in cell wall biosynthesis
MACGTPVVATRVGGIPEVLPEEAGLLVPAHERQALADALVDALARPWDPARIVEHAGRFSWERNLEQLSRILESAAAAPSLPGSSRS